MNESTMFVYRNPTVSVSTDLQTIIEESIICPADGVLVDETDDTIDYGAIYGIPCKIVKWGIGAGGVAYAETMEHVNVYFTMNPWLMSEDGVIDDVLELLKSAKVSIDDIDFNLTLNPVEGGVYYDLIVGNDHQIFNIEPSVEKSMSWANRDTHMQ